MFPIWVLIGRNTYYLLIAVTTLGIYLLIVVSNLAFLPIILKSSITVGNNQKVLVHCEMDTWMDRVF